METAQAKDSTSETLYEACFPGICWAPGKVRNIYADNIFTAILVGNEHDALQWMEGRLTDLPIGGYLHISRTQTKPIGSRDTIADQVHRISTIRATKSDMYRMEDLLWWKRDIRQEIIRRNDK